MLGWHAYERASEVWSKRKPAYTTRSFSRHTKCQWLRVASIGSYPQGCGGDQEVPIGNEHALPAEKCAQPASGKAVDDATGITVKVDKSSYIGRSACRARSQSARVESYRLPGGVRCRHLW